MAHATATRSTATPTTGTPTTPAGRRPLYLLRAGFSLVWVALVLTTSGSLVATDGPTAIAGVLLVVYPLWDVVATALEHGKAGLGSTNRVSITTMVLGVAAAVATSIAIFTTLGSALLVFGIWASLSGATQLAVAIQRRHTVGAGWPMIISGGLSVLAGASIAASAGSATSGLTTVAGYSAFGAFWFLVSAITLTIRNRRTH